MTYLVNSIGYVAFAFNARHVDTAIADSTGVLGLHVNAKRQPRRE